MTNQILPACKAMAASPSRAGMDLCANALRSRAEIALTLRWSWRPFAFFHAMRQAHVPKVRGLPARSTAGLSSPRELTSWRQDQTKLTQKVYCGLLKATESRIAVTAEVRFFTCIQVSSLS